MKCFWRRTTKELDGDANYNVSCWLRAPRKATNIIQILLIQPFTCWYFYYSAKHLNGSLYKQTGSQTNTNTQRCLIFIVFRTQRRRTVRAFAFTSFESIIGSSLWAALPVRRQQWRRQKNFCLWTAIKTALVMIALQISQPRTTYVRHVNWQLFMVIIVTLMMPAMMFASASVSHWLASLSSMILSIFSRYIHKVSYLFPRSSVWRGRQW